MNKIITQVDIIPPDIERCQVYVPDGHNFMTLGGVLGRVRCSNKPVCITVHQRKEIK